jgi:hypothetical protein
MQPTDIDTTRSPVTLVVWRWPRPTTWPTRPTTLFAACHLIMAKDGCVIAAVRSAEPGTEAARHLGGTVEEVRATHPARWGQTYASHAEHMAQLLPAAQDAGFRHVLQIVAVGGRDSGDQFVYHATSNEAAQAASDPTTGGRVCHVDLLAFTP